EVTVDCPAKLAAVSTRIQALMRTMLWAIRWTILGAMELREIELTTVMMRLGTYAPFRSSSRFHHGSKPEIASEWNRTSSGCCKLLMRNDLQSVHSRRIEREEMEAKAWMLHRPERVPTSESRS